MQMNDVLENQNEAQLAKLKQFMANFRFSRTGGWNIGIEREWFITDQDGRIQPLAPTILGTCFTIKNGKHGNKLAIAQSDRDYGYELSACQIENRIGPCHITYVRHALEQQELLLIVKERELNFRRSYYEVAPADMPLDIYPDPAGRYQKITAKMSPEVLGAACRVTGTHIHVGLPDHDTALRVYNHAINYCDELCALGDHSSGERLKLYMVVAPDCQPVSYPSWEAYYQYADRIGFATEPRNCWHLIRLSKNGTIEFRNFGATADLDEICGWAKRCFEICREVA